MRAKSAPHTATYMCGRKGKSVLWVVLLICTCFSSCSVSRSHIVALLQFQTNLFWIFVLFLCILTSRLFMMLHIVIYCLNSAIADNKRELIQVAANVIIPKRCLKPHKLKELKTFHT